MSQILSMKFKLCDYVRGRTSFKIYRWCHDAIFAPPKTYEICKVFTRPDVIDIWRECCQTCGKEGHGEPSWNGSNLKGTEEEKNSEKWGTKG